jgi:hypothetical protein
MATTQNTYTGNGSTVLYSFTFPYLETANIKVSLNGVDTTAYTLANATTIQFNTAPANGLAVRIYRETDDQSLIAQFYPGSAIRSQDLNENFTKAWYVAQETKNITVQASTGTLADGSITSNFVANQSITPAKLDRAYLEPATAASLYLLQTNASTTYLTQSNASTTYLTQSNAAATYATKGAALALAIALG